MMFFGVLDDPWHTPALGKTWNPWISFYNALFCTPNWHFKQKLQPEKIDVPNNHLKAHKTFGNSSSRAMVLDL